MSTSRTDGPHIESCRQVQKQCPTHWRSHARKKKIYPSKLKFCFNSMLCEHLVSSLATLSWSYRLTLISMIITGHNYQAGTRHTCNSEDTELQSRSEIHRWKTPERLKFISLLSSHPPEMIEQRLAIFISLFQCNEYIRRSTVQCTHLHPPHIGACAHPFLLH